jgi:Asp-tRNA(Asn)/Glu-tRNA(Gln) amidotransferase B subunit
VAKAAANWICNELFGQLSDAAASPPAAAAAAPPTATTAAPNSLAALRLPPQHLGALIALVETGDVSTRGARDTLALMLQQVQAGEGGPPESPRAIVDARGWRQLNDAAAITAIAREALLSPAAAADAALAAGIAQVRAGRTRVLGALVHRVLTASGGRANPTVATEVVKALLGVAEPAAVGGERAAGGEAAAGQGGRRDGSGGTGGKGSARKT